jgi:hypothetical protein
LGLKGNLKPKILICFSMKNWPQYKLCNSNKLPKFETFNPNVLWDLENFIVRKGKWQEVSYLFSSFISSPDPPFVQAAGACRFYSSSPLSQTEN